MNDELIKKELLSKLKKEGFSEDKSQSYLDLISIMFNDFEIFIKNIIKTLKENDEIISECPGPIYAVFGVFVKSIYRLLKGIQLTQKVKNLKKSMDEKSLADAGDEIEDILKSFKVFCELDE
jgi:hypothetical protein